MRVPIAFAYDLVEPTKCVQPLFHFDEQSWICCVLIPSAEVFDFMPRCDRHGRALSEKWCEKS